MLSGSPPPRICEAAKQLATLSTNGRRGLATLPWPKDARGVREEDIGWYRIGYRVEVNGSERLHGVLSVGAITANLMELRLAYPKMIAQAHALSARVIAVNPVTGKALPGVNLKATLSDDEDNSKKKSFTRVAKTGRNGEAILTFAPLGEPGDSLGLTVEGTLTGQGGALVRDSVNGDMEVMDLGNMHVEMDKPLHKPGETVHLRALAFRNGGHTVRMNPSL